MHPTFPRPFLRAFRLFPFLMGSTASSSHSHSHAGLSTNVAPLPATATHAYFAAGCFWGVEHAFRREFGARLLALRVGYTGGNDDGARRPTYRAVCSGTTGHAEALDVAFAPAAVSYAELVEFFYRMHDPTTRDRQGPDVGSQYRSAIFCADAAQETVAREVTRRVNERWFGGSVKTEIVRVGQWWDAEEYHQLYLEKNPSGYECPSHYVRKFPTVLDEPIEV